VQREGNDPHDLRTITYGELTAEVCKFANVLRRHGVEKGDFVCIYMPMIPEVPIAMLSCARIGAVHTVVVSHSRACFCRATFIYPGKWI
jgi:acetyl-CoA synthetase